MLITNNKNLDQLTPGSSGWVRRSEDRQINQIKWWIQQIFGPFSVTTADLNETWRDTALVNPHLVSWARIINKATIFVSMESLLVFPLTKQLWWPDSDPGQAGDVDFPMNHNQDILTQNRILLLCYQYWTNGLVRAVHLVPSSNCVWTNTYLAAFYWQ